MTDVSTTCVEVIFTVTRSGLCSPKDCCWLWLTSRQPVWKSPSESLGRVCVVLRGTLLVVTGVSTNCVEVMFRVIVSGLCSPEKDCCWLWLTFRQPVWKSSPESLGRVCVILRRTLLVVTDVSTTCVEVIFRVIGSGLCSREKDCCWLWLTFRQPVWKDWKSSSELLLCRSDSSYSMCWRKVIQYLWLCGFLISRQSLSGCCLIYVCNYVALLSKVLIAVKSLICRWYSPTNNVYLR